MQKERALTPSYSVFRWQSMTSIRAQLSEMSALYCIFITKVLRKVPSIHLYAEPPPYSYIYTCNMGVHDTPLAPLLSSTQQNASHVFSPSSAARSTRSLLSLCQAVARSAAAAQPEYCCSIRQDVSEGSQGLRSSQPHSSTVVPYTQKPLSQSDEHY